MNVTKTIPAHLARTQLGQIIDLALAKRARFVVSRNGQPAVIILALEDYLEGVVETPEPLAALQAKSRKRGLDLLSMDEIDTVVTKARRERAKKRA